MKEKEENAVNENDNVGDTSGEEHVRTAREAEADHAKEFLDDFLTPIGQSEDQTYEEFGYAMREKWSDRNREKAKDYVQALYNMAIGRR